MCGMSHTAGPSSPEPDSSTTPDPLTDPPRPAVPAEPHDTKHGPATGLALAALGVVFGDIGTSPLYSLQTVFSINHNAVAATREDVFGVISMVFWTLMIIVTFKYAMLVMRADNDGEGGILSLVALLRLKLGGNTKFVGPPSWHHRRLLYGDSVYRRSP